MRIRDILFEFAPSGGGDSGNYFQALASAWYNGTFDTGSLQKGIKSQEDVERLLNRGIVCPDGKTRKLHIDYNANFDGVEIYSDDYYEYGDHDDTIDSRTGQPFGPYEHIEFAGHHLDESIDEAKYHGREVSLGKKMSGDVKKYKVYVRNPKTGNIKKVNFGDPNMRIHKSNPARRRSFRARHHCDNPGPRTSANYWSCRNW
jgi:hypothetical protein